MNQKGVYPDWKKVVVYSEKGPKPQVLEQNDKFKAVLGGLAPGASIPPHPEGPAVFHFLEGSGRMIVDEEKISVKAGATVIVPDGARRGMEAETQLAFLAIRIY